MPRIRKFNSSNKFKGNIHTRSSGAKSNIGLNKTPPPAAYRGQPSSSKKLSS